MKNENVKSVIVVKCTNPDGHSEEMKINSNDPLLYLLNGLQTLITEEELQKLNEQTDKVANEKIQREAQEDAVNVNKMLGIPAQTESIVEDPYSWIDEEFKKFNGKLIASDCKEFKSRFDEALDKFNKSMKGVKESEKILLAEISAENKRLRGIDYSIKELTKSKLKTESDNSTLIDRLNEEVNRNRDLEDLVKILKLKCTLQEEPVKKAEDEKAFLALLLKNVYHAVKYENACACKIENYLESNKQSFM